MKRRWFLAAVMALSGAAGAWAQPMARVEGEPIDQEDVRILAREIFEFKEDPLPEARLQELFRKALSNRILAREAKVRHPEAVAAVGRQVALRLAGEYVDPYWKKYAYPKAEKEVTTKKLLEQVPEQPGAAHLHQIVCADEATAQDVLRRLKKKEFTFAEAARRFSKGLTAKNGGDLGGIKRTDARYSPELMELIFTMPVGKVSEVVPYSLGPSILLVSERKTGEQLRREQAEGLRGEAVKGLAKEYLFRDAEEYGRRNGFRLLLKEEAAEAAAADLARPVIEAPGSIYTVEDLIAQSGGQVHGDKVLMSIAETAFRNLALQAKYAKAHGKLKDHDRRRRVFEDHYAARKLINRAMDHLEVTEADLQAYVAANRQEFLIPETVDIGMVMVRTKERLAQVQKLLAEGKDFAEVAQAWSLDDSAKRGGRIGFGPVEGLPPPFDAVTKLAAGQVSAPIEAPDETGPRYYLIKVYERKAAHTATRGDLSSDGEGRLRAKILAGKREKVLADLLQGLFDKARVEIL